MILTPKMVLEDRIKDVYEEMDAMYGFDMSWSDWENADLVSISDIMDYVEEQIKEK